jgi:DNA-binding GntR family transcriptional regulator
MTDTTGRVTPHLEELAARLTNGYKTIGEMVYEVIHESIVAGVFAPGERLRQEALATAIGVSRIPVRSALLQLESEGLVDFHPRRGAVVRSLTTAQLRELYELRELLEPYALEKSIATMTPDRVERLQTLASALYAEHEGQEFLELRITFYRELYNYELNPQLVKIIEDLRGAVGRYLLGWRVAQKHDHSHRALADAVATGDVAEARKHLLAHLEQVREGLESLVTNAAAEVKDDTSVPKRSA